MRKRSALTSRNSGYDKAMLINNAKEMAMEFVAQVWDTNGKQAVIVEAESMEAARKKLLEMGYLSVMWIM